MCVEGKRTGEKRWNRERKEFEKGGEMRMLENGKGLDAADFING